DVVEQTFEAWHVEPEAFDLAICAQAFHWVAADLRFAKAAAALRPGGVLAIFGHVPRPGSGSLRQALDAAYACHAPALTMEAPRLHWYEDEAHRTGDFAESGLFGPVTTRSYAWSQAYTADEYTALVRTYSEHRLLPAAQLDALTAGIHQAIAAHG